MVEEEKAVERVAEVLLEFEDCPWGDLTPMKGGKGVIIVCSTPSLFVANRSVDSTSKASDIFGAGVSASCCTVERSGGRTSQDRGDELVRLFLETLSEMESKSDKQPVKEASEARACEEGLPSAPMPNVGDAKNGGLPGAVAGGGVMVPPPITVVAS